MVLEDKAFKRTSLQAFIETADANRDMENFPLASAYPVEQVEEIDNVYDIVQNQINVAAVVTGFNSGAPIRNKGQGKQAIARLTKIQDAYYLDEKELLHYRNPRSTEEQQKIVDAVLISTEKLSEAVEKTKELMRAQMTYNGVFEYEDPRTETKLSYTLDRPQSNNLTSAKAWGTQDAEPLTDLLSAIDRFKETNGNTKPEVINMNSKTLAKLKRSGQIKSELYNDSNSARLVRESDFNELLNEFGIPTIQVDDNETAIEQIDGTPKVIKHLEDDKVVLRASVLGSTLSGPNVENNFAKGKFVTTVMAQDPVTEKTIVGEVAMPITKNVNGTVFIDVNPS